MKISVPLFCSCIVIATFSETILAACEAELKQYAEEHWNSGPASGKSFLEDFNSNLQTLESNKDLNGVEQNLKWINSAEGIRFYSNGTTDRAARDCKISALQALKARLQNKTGTVASTGPAKTSVGNFYSRVQFVDIKSSNDWEHQDPSNDKRKKLVLNNYGKQCIQPTDIRMDKDVPGMYWYKMQNNCTQDLLVTWCDYAGGKPCTGKANSAWKIDAGESYEAWSGVDPKSGSYHLRWWACQKNYQDQDVNFDDKTGECWAWRN